MPRLIRIFWYSVLISFTLNAKSHEDKMLIFGVFSYLGEEQTHAKFSPIVDYLNTQLEQEQLVLRVLPFDVLVEQMKQGHIDILAINPTQYIMARQQFEISGVIATLVESHQGQAVHQLGGTIITRQDRDDLHRLTDLKTKIIGVPSRFNMGGFRTQIYELHQAGVNINRELNITELGSHEAVVKAVIAQQVEAGFIRDGVLEAMIENGQIQADQVKVIQPHHYPHFPNQVSTRLYPEWPIFALQHVNEQAVRHLASALYSLKPEHPAAQAAGIHGFTIPADYYAVEELARNLRLPPFDQLPDFSFQDTWDRWKLIYWLGIIAIVSILSFMLAIAYGLRREKSEHDRFEHLISMLGEGVYGTDLEGNCTFINPAALKMLNVDDEKQVLGKNQHDMFHHHYPNGEPYDQSICPIQLTTQDGKIRRCEEWFFKRNGMGFPVNLTVTALYRRNKLAGAVVVFQDITELKNLQNNLLAQSRFDELTGLANRRYLLELVKQEFNRIKRNLHNAVIIMADLDHFKRVNDTYGHAAGDEVLKSFAKLMQMNLRNTDIIGRLGGEEFLIMLPETDIQTSLEIIERLRENVAAFRLDYASKQIAFTVSLGLVEVSAKDENIETLITNADNALYQAKSQGRNRSEVFQANPPSNPAS